VLRGPKKDGTLLTTEWTGQRDLRTLLPTAFSSKTITRFDGSSMSAIAMLQQLVEAVQITLRQSEWNELARKKLPLVIPQDLSGLRQLERKLLGRAVAPDFERRTPPFS
jgi:hypothetical protein